MPETPVYEDHFAAPRKHQVWRTGQITTVEPVAESKAMNELSHEHFRLSVLSAHERHARRAL